MTEIYKRTHQGSACNGPRKMDNGRVITRCSDCTSVRVCSLMRCGEIINKACTLPAAPEEE